MNIPIKIYFRKEQQGKNYANLEVAKVVESKSNYKSRHMFLEVAEANF